MWKLIRDRLTGIMPSNLAQNNNNKNTKKNNNNTKKIIIIQKNNNNNNNHHHPHHCISQSFSFPRSHWLLSMT